MNSLRPYLRESVRIGIIMGAGDVLAQTYSEGKSIEQLDKVRTAKFAAIGFFFLGPSLKWWYGVLDRVVSKDQPKLQIGVKKMLLDQTIVAPTITAVITGIISAMNGESKKQFEDRMRKDYFQIMKANYMLWPAAQIINFTLVPINYQVVFAQIVAIFWNAYLSTKLNK